MNFEIETKLTLNPNLRAICRCLHIKNLEELLLLCSMFVCALRIKYIFYKQLGSGLSRQSCLYFQGFRGSKLLNGCLAVWTSNLCLPGIQEFSQFKINIYDQWFQKFPNNAFVTATVWCIVSLTTILRLLQRKNSTFI